MHQFSILEQKDNDELLDDTPFTCSPLTFYLLLYARQANNGNLWLVLSKWSNTLETNCNYLLFVIERRLSSRNNNNNTNSNSNSNKATSNKLISLSLLHLLLYSLQKIALKRERERERGG